MPRATGATEPILAAARELVAAAAPLIAARGLTLVGFAVSKIDRDGAQQLELPLEGPAAQNQFAVDLAVDDVRRRYGNAALTRGVLVDARCAPTERRRTPVSGSSWLAPQTCGNTMSVAELDAVVLAKAKSSVSAAPCAAWARA